MDSGGDGGGLRKGCGRHSQNFKETCGCRWRVLQPPDRVGRVEPMSPPAFKGGSLEGDEDLIPFISGFRPILMGMLGENGHQIPRRESAVHPPAIAITSSSIQQENQSIHAIDSKLGKPSARRATKPATKFRISYRIRRAGKRNDAGWGSFVRHIRKIHAGIQDVHSQMEGCG
jgi:hypothetical protein